MAGVNGGVQPTPGGPMDPSGTQPGWIFPKAKDMPVDREAERKGRALTTVNSDDFGIKPRPATPEAD